MRSRARSKTPMKPIMSPARAPTFHPANGMRGHRLSKDKSKRPLSSVTTATTMRFRNSSVSVLGLRRLSLARGDDCRWRWRHRATARANTEEHAKTVVRVDTQCAARYLRLSL